MKKLTGGVFHNKKSENEESWMSVSDMMAGLMLVFLLIAVVLPSIEQYAGAAETSQDGKDERNAVLAGAGQGVEGAKTRQGAEDERSAVLAASGQSIEDAEVSRDVKDEVLAGIGQDIEATVIRICDELGELLREIPKERVVWSERICENGVVIRFEDSLGFKKGSAEIKPEFKQFLSSFFPGLMQRLWKHKDEISELRIEGHTSSEAGAEGKLDAYLYNANLSQQRSRSVLEYVLGLPEIRSNEQYVDWLIEHVTAHGLSSSNRVEINETDEKSRSVNRRIEFRIETTAVREILKKIENAKAKRPR